MTAILNGTNAVPAAGVDHLPELDIRVESISSRQAAQWLETYKGPNRRLNEAQVLRYQADMESGRWHFEGAPIKISRTNKLLDGQHRLTALANTVPEMEVTFVVIRGLDDDAQLYMDQLLSRTVSQQLSLRGVPNSSVYASVGKLYLEWTRGRLFKSTSRGSTSKPEVTEWVLEHRELLEKLSEISFQKVDAPTSVVGAFTLAVLQISPIRAHRFISQLVSGAGLHEGDPILALDRRLRNIRRSGVRVSQREYLAYFIKAWNAWVMGDRLQKIQLSQLSDDNFPELLTISDTPVE